ncbi:MAG: MFS transporter [Acidimicrobiia bacterium]|nr:MFS transporter [Acidimicrobiia bacterium]
MAVKNSPAIKPDGETKTKARSPGPSPEERADFVVKRLEEFIREKKSPEGMNFKHWQALCKAEIAAAIAAAVKEQTRGDAALKRVLFTGAAALVTVGFWGAAVSVGRADYMIAGIICVIAGLVFMAVAAEWSLAGWRARRRARERMETLARVGDLDKRLKAIEKKREKEVESANK